ncbi:hypothetical protein EZS27_040754 [termite gut metagenome]|uniref:Resolvase/invertase-type recombinase catalytic domain-containing protein n=1 Tax=termite gut metagenome TaxID=433724 RepID=A0A5J4PGG8_9ZZZZ
MRISTLAQSLDEQSNDLQKKALQDNYKEDEIIIIEDKESGIKLSDEERNELNRMYQAIEDNNTIETVYIWELSRLSRRQTTLLKLNRC